MKNRSGNANFKSASFTVSLVIILLFSAVIFFIGWTQIKVHSNHIGVVVSKISGISDTPVVPGKFSWHWDFLIPKNAELKIFDTKPYTFSKKIKGVLPSGEVYQAAYSGQPDFSYNFDFDITVFIHPEDIIELMKKSKFSDQASLEKYLDNSCDEIARAAASTFLKKAEEDMFFRPETVVTEDIVYDTGAKKKFPNLDFQNFTVTNAKFPDFKLYENVRERYIDQLSSPYIIKTPSETMPSVSSADKNDSEKKSADSVSPDAEKTETKNDTASDDETEKLFDNVKSYIW